MREIKFRGKRLETNEWIYGYYIKYQNGYTCIETGAGETILGNYIDNTPNTNTNH